MTLDFSRYLVLNMFYLGLKYKTCVVSTKKKCKSEPLEYEWGVDEKRCKERCSENSQCKFITYSHGVDQEAWCLLFEFCDKLEIVAKTGTIFAKDTCPGKIYYLKVYVGKPVVILTFGRYFAIHYFSTHTKYYYS